MNIKHISDPKQFHPGVTSLKQEIRDFNEETILS